MRNKILPALLFLTSGLIISGCEKLLDVPPPINSITTEELFVNNKQAEWAMAGIYTKMINGIATNAADLANVPNNIFSGGLSTLQGGLSADEIIATSVSGADYYSQRNKLTVEVSADKPDHLWYSTYRTISDANALIDGIALSTSPSLIDSVKKQLTGEALALRAFSYFYLVNYYGELPLVITSDFKKTVSLSRSPVSKVYDQIKADLIKAKALLGSDYSVGGNKRSRVNKWFVEALLARVYLYTGEYQLAINSATAVIDQSDLFKLEQDISNTFLPNSPETIFQLIPTTGLLNNATPEGHVFHLLFRPYAISNELLDAFEVNDKRKLTWIKLDGATFIPAKYSKGNPVQYYKVMRLAEQILIRAEATVLYNPSAKNNAIDDINQLRRRAGLTELDYSLTADEVLHAIAHERRVELFLEWGHRWFDLKRTAKAHDVLSIISYKVPWEGDHQLLYPVPKEEIRVNGRLVQNPGYNN
ncbi:RagB/SusD family nutrient uptake outer membrane protein [Pseudobacter ginsenosidimutans]|uniref:SusD-like starch-binding protein associating with outer membrane n=1 Tax=Pseudobacter ginsenosidimutans TaxID=661488 RepID=A0A4Q7MT34_9BACT|nr:RagB/SusD family nutrient uptake outer membrane protein [Pseudobacter ginsenosidimutans]QEC42101.1 RagB/SusD family nutrient uptake outer membrane protein [Pseudobacter ginsenosidimutans]RZS71059.1 SusD-like starch-binding protein associating with outer membrane [Pseudobacter ginsenosidimutans]